MLGNFSYYNPTKLYFGDESLNFLKDELKGYGPVVLLNYGSGSVKRNGIYDQAIALPTEVEIVVAGQTALGRNDVCIRIMIGDVIDGGIGMTADTAIFPANHLTDKQGNCRRDRISFDHVVQVMKRTGHDLPSLYKETSEGGLALEYEE